MTPVYLTPQLVKTAGVLDRAVSAVAPYTGLATGLGVSAPFVPWSSMHALNDKMQGTASKNELPQAATTDTSRGVGALLGMGAAKGISETTGLAEHAHGKPLLRAAIMLAGAGGGALLGQLKGRSLGRELFPGSLHDRLNHALDNF